MRTGYDTMDCNYLGVIFMATEDCRSGMNAALALLEQKINGISYIGPVNGGL